MLQLVEIGVAFVLVVLLFREKPAQIIHVLRLLAIVVLILSLVPTVRFSFSIEGFNGNAAHVPSGSAGPVPDPHTYSSGVGQSEPDIARQSGTYAFDPHFIRGDTGLGGIVGVPPRGDATKKETHV